MTSDSKEFDTPMPSGVEAMSKQQLWNWFHRCERAAAESHYLRDRFFTTTTGLHSARSSILGDTHAIIEEQRKRVRGLEQQMAEMQKGYDKKLRKAQAVAVAPGNEALALLRAVRDSFLSAEDDGSISVSPEIDGALFDAMCKLLPALPASSLSVPSPTAHSPLTCG